jgi:hypothetical protein
MGSLYAPRHRPVQGKSIPTTVARMPALPEDACLITFWGATRAVDHATSRPPALSFEYRDVQVYESSKEHEIHARLRSHDPGLDIASVICHLVISEPLCLKLA